MKRPSPKIVQWRFRDLVTDFFSQWRSATIFFRNLDIFPASSPLPITVRQIKVGIYWGWLLTYSWFSPILDSWSVITIWIFREKKIGRIGTEEGNGRVDFLLIFRSNFGPPPLSRFRIFQISGIRVWNILRSLSLLESQTLRETQIKGESAKKFLVLTPSFWWKIIFRLSGKRPQSEFRMTDSIYFLEHFISILFSPLFKSVGFPPCSIFLAGKELKCRIINRLLFQKHIFVTQIGKRCWNTSRKGKGRLRYLNRLHFYYIKHKLK